MIAAVDKEGFAKLLQNRPALVKKLDNPSEELICELLKAAPEAYEYLDQTAERCIAYLTGLVNRMEGWEPLSSRRYIGLDVDIPDSHWNQLPENLLAKVLKHYPTNVTKIKNPSYEMYKGLIAGGSDDALQSLPDEYCTEEMAFIAIKKKFYHLGKLQRAVTNRLYNYRVKISPSQINEIPAEALTPTILKRAIRHATDNVSFEPKKDVWNDELVDAALEKSPQTISNIPRRFLTHERITRVLRENGHLFFSLPEDLKKKWRYQKYIINDGISKYLVHLYNFTNLNNPEWQVYVCDTPDGLESLYNLGAHPEEETLLKILGKAPTGIVHIPKPDQTTKMIEVIAGNIQEEDWRWIADGINLTRITVDIAPLLVGINVDRIKEVVERKFKCTKRPTKRKEEEVVVKDNQIRVKITPKELSELRKTYNL